MANAIFLKLEGADGECTDEAHDKEITVNNFSWGVANTATMDQSEGVSAGKAIVMELSVEKTLDTASPVIFQRCASGKTFDKAILSVQRAGGEKVQALQITLENVYVSGYQISDTKGSGGLPSEMVTLAYDNVKFVYKKQKKDGSEDASVDAGYDLVKNVVT